jgi:hypothetical protein
MRHFVSLTRVLLTLTSLALILLSSSTLAAQRNQKVAIYLVYQDDTNRKPIFQVPLHGRSPSEDS